MAIGIVEDHPDAAYISSRLGTAGLVNKVLGRNDADVDPTDDLSVKFERLCQCVNLGDLTALDKILQFNPEAPGAGIQSKIMHLMNEIEYDRLFANRNVRSKGRLLSLRWLGVGVLHRPIVALYRPHPATARLPACRPVPAGLEDMPSRPLPEVSSARDGLVWRPRRDLQARATHHSPPRPHAVRAEHHCQ